MNITMAKGRALNFFPCLSIGLLDNRRESWIIFNRIMKTMAGLCFFRESYSRTQFVEGIVAIQG